MNSRTTFAQNPSIKIVRIFCDISSGSKQKDPRKIQSGFDLKTENISKFIKKKLQFFRALNHCGKKCHLSILNNFFYKFTMATSDHSASLCQFKCFSCNAIPTDEQVNKCSNGHTICLKCSGSKRCKVGICWNFWFFLFHNFWTDFFQEIFNIFNTDQFQHLNFRVSSLIYTVSIGEFGAIAESTLANCADNN